MKLFRGQSNGVLVLIVITSLLIASGIVGRTSVDSPKEASESLDELPFSSAPEDSPFNGVLPEVIDRYNELLNYSDVMVVRNLNSLTSMEIADYFIQQREIPPENICNVSTATTEVIDRTTFNDLRAQVEANMSAHGLLDRINYIVTTKGVPLKVSDSVFWYRAASVDSELSMMDGPYSGYIGNFWWASNPYFNSTESFSHQLHGTYTITRLTGYTVEDAKALVDRATGGIGRKGRFVLDIDPRKSGGYVVGNDWMSIAYDILYSRGFDVFKDLNNTFVNNLTDVAGYTSWGSNDGSWYIPENNNTGFENDVNSDSIPDGWFKTDNPGLSEVVRSDQDPQSDSWSVRMNRTQINENYTAISQNVSIIPERRYVLMGSANLTNVSGDKGMHLQIKSYASNGTLMDTLNGSVRSGTTPVYRGLGQVIFEPKTGVSKLVVSAVFSKSNGTVFVDNVRLIEIKPHVSFVDGAVGETYVSTGGRSHTYGTWYGQSLVADLIKEGITGIKGYVYEPYLDAVAHPNILFERYTRGFGLGESFAAASEISLGWMDTILGDPKVAPYNTSYIPDLAIEPSNFTVSNDAIVLGTNISISAIAENRGNFPTVNATVSFYIGDPESGGVPFHNLTRTIGHRDWTEAGFTWKPNGAGEFDLCVFLDPADEFYELNESNNIACEHVRITDGIHLGLGWNLISLPLLPSDTRLTEILKSIDGEYDMVRFFDPLDSLDPWKSFSTFKPQGFDDLAVLDNRIGFWIHITTSTVLPLEGTLQTSTAIELYRGWNLIGFPSLSDQRIEDVFASLPVIRIEAFTGGTDPYLLRALDSRDYMTAGKGYWVEVSSDCTLTVFA